MFCFPITDHVMVPQKTVSFKCCLIHVYPRAYVCISNEKTKGKFPGEHRVVWIGKTKHTSQKGLFGENFITCYLWKSQAKDVCFDRFLPRLAASSLEKILGESGIHIDKAAIEQEQQENSDFTCKSSSNHFQTHFEDLSPLKTGWTDDVIP